MATDIVAITGHTMTLSEVIDLPNQINKWTALKEMYHNNYRIKAEFEYPQKQHQKVDLLESYWNTKLNHSTLLDSWNHNENLPEDCPVYNDICLHTYFGWLKINRHSLRIVLFPEHKYANFFYFKQCEYILLFNRALAKMFEQNKIIYTADNGYGFEEIENKAIEGEKFEELLKFVEEKCLVVNSNLVVDKIRSMCFVDENSSDIEFFEELSWRDIEK